jgi:hypothetical protein
MTMKKQQFPDRDVETGRNVLKRFLHKPKEEQDAILRDWFKKTNTPEFAAFMAKIREGRES